MKERKVSVIVPIYNAEEYILNTVKSILNQSYQNVELILVDDGSTDNTKKILKKIKKESPNVKLLFQKNSGAPTARNNGFKMASGEYIVFFDSDDYMYRDYIKQALSTKGDYDLIITAYEVRFDNKKEIVKWKFKYERDINLKEALYYIPPFPDNKIYKRDIIVKNEITFDNVKIAQDLNFYLKYLKYIDPNKVRIVDRVGVGYYSHQNSISSTYNLKILDVIKSIDLIIEYGYTYEDEILKVVRIQHYAAQLFKLDKYSKKDIIYIKKVFKENIKRIGLFNISRKRKRRNIKYIIYIMLTFLIPPLLNVKLNKLIKK